MMRVLDRSGSTDNDRQGTMTAGYNSPTFMTRTGARPFAIVALALLVCLPAAAQWSEPASHLAREIAAITGPGAVGLSIRNISSLSADQVLLIQRELQSAMASAGVQVVKPNAAAAEIQLTLSENAQGYVWIAQIRQAGDAKVAMVTAARSRAATPQASGPLVSVRKTPLWSQDAPMLDVALLPGPSEPHMVVLDPASVSLYKISAGRWTMEAQWPIENLRTWPRDIRGRLAPARDHLFDAYLPGVVCATSTMPPLSLQCHNSDDPWPISNGQTAMFGASRNFFTGVVTPAMGKLTNVPAFYSAAGLPRPTYTLWVFARTDGSVHLMDGVNDLAIRSARDWGSDLAAVKSSCGTGTQLLVSGAGDARTSDTVRAFEIADREPVEVSPPVEFAGPVTALWTSVDGRTAIAVSRNLKTGRYDAFELAITCGQ